MELHAESLAIAEAAGDWQAAANAHDSLGFASWLQRDFDRATAECTAALGMFRELGHVVGIASSLLNLGAVARYQGDRERAAALLAESRSLSEGIGFREGIAWSLEQLGLLAADRGEPGAAPLLRRSLELHRELGDRWRTSSVLDDLAAWALARGRAAQAVRLLGAAEAMRVTIGTVIAPCERAQQTQTAAAARGLLGEGAFTAAWQQGLLAQIDDLHAELAAAGPSAVAAPGPADEAAAAAELTPAGPSAAAAPEPADEAAASTGTAAAAAGAEPAQRAKTPRPAGGRPQQQPAAADQGSRPDGDSKNAKTGVAGENSNGLLRLRELRIRALGAATVHRGDVLVTAADWGYAKPRELLFLLATSAPMTRAQLGAALWPDLPRQQLGNALHTALRGLRRAVGDPGWVLYADGRYAFNRAGEHDCDVETFEQALGAARRARPPAAALPDLQRAIAAYGGDFLAGMAAGEWAHARREELRRGFESALLAAGRLHAAAGRYHQAAAALRRAVAHEPLNETAHRELMNCWARLGETARAVRHYEELVELLRREVGVPPAAETTALYRRLLEAP
jgi:DNA-binding SARP family transcriptional activator